jgi:type IV secretion system protein VirB6
MNGCAIATNMGVVRDVLTAVNCNTRGFARMGYESLTLAGSPFQVALTLLLTVYVAITGYRLFFAFGGARLSDGPGIALKIGAVLALVTSWSVFQTLVFNMAAYAPVEIARAITAPLRSGSSLAADPIGGLQIAYDQLSAAAAALAKPTKLAADIDQNSIATASQALSLASNALLLTSAGLIAVITVAIGVLTAIGPLFVALFMFVETRGFFVGWVRALTAAAFGLLSTWTITILMLHVLDPWLVALSGRNAADPPDIQVSITTAAIVFVFAVSQIGILLAGIVISRGFRLNFSRPGIVAASQRMRESVASSNQFEPISRPERLAQQLQRHDNPSFGFNRIDAAAAAASATRGSRTASTPTALLGGTRYPVDLYRRPAVTRSDLAR